MRKLYCLLENLTRDERAQDMVEYALLAGFLAVSAGALLPGIADGISIILSKMGSLVTNAAAQSVVIRRLSSSASWRSSRFNKLA